MNIPGHGLYVPVQKRLACGAPSVRSSSSGPWRKPHSNSDKDGEDLKPRSPQQMIYSISELLQLSRSPLARLSYQQERVLRDHLYLASGRNHSELNPSSEKALLSMNSAPTVAGNAAAMYNRQKLNRRRRSGNVRRNSADLAIKRRKGLGYGIHQTAVQSDWRRSESDGYNSIVPFGA